MSKYKSRFEISRLRRTLKIVNEPRGDFTTYFVSYLKRKIQLGDVPV